LFRNKTKDTRKTNLYIFIRPSIIKPRFEGGPDEYTKLKLDYAKYQIMNVEELRRTKDPIQRWFFKPEGQSIRQTLKDLRKGFIYLFSSARYSHIVPKIRICKDNKLV